MSEWLYGTLLATTGLIAFVLLVREPVRKRFGSRVTYALWLIPAARLFMPPLTLTVERPLPAEIVHPLAASPLRDSVWMARVAPADASVIDRLGGWPAILFAIWLGVAAILFLSRVIAFYCDRRAILASAVESVSLGSVRMVRTPEVVSPVALGIFDRVIAVPSDFERRYGHRERRLVLEHELAHHRSGDLVANLFAFVLLCLQWFNPLAWVAHAAFRFDQEAACDARVLDKANGCDRAHYARAIAKAASGRALLFASALDRRNRLHRRLQSMLRSSNPAQRFLGRLMVLTAIAVALPLTASHSIEYVDVLAPAKSPASVVLPAQAAASAAASDAVPVSAAAQAVQSVPSVAPAPAVSADIDGTIITGDLITINGRTKRWDELTPAEKAQVRSAVARARAGLAQAHLDSDRIVRQIGDVRSQVRMDKILRDVAGAQAHADQAMRGIDESAPYLRQSGADPERIKAAIGKAMQSVQKIDTADLDQQLARIDPQMMQASMAAAERAMSAAKAELDRLDARIGEGKDR